MRHRIATVALGLLVAALSIAGAVAILLQERPPPLHEPLPAPPPPWSDRAVDDAAPSALEAQWGIRLLGVRRVAAGYALDLRMRVVDPGRAAPLLQRKYSRSPHLVVEKSGAVLQVPWSEKVGTMRQSVRTANQIKRDRHYFVLFANPGRHVEAGDQVTVVIGDFRAEHVPVL